jgi:EthD domain
LAPPPLTYKRNFLLRDDTAAPQDEVDIITELVFPDRHAYEAWVSTMYAPGSGVAEDEARFLDRSKTRSYVVEERST